MISTLKDLSTCLIGSKSLTLAILEGYEVGELSSLIETALPILETLPKESLTARLNSEMKLFSEAERQTHIALFRMITDGAEYGNASMRYRFYAQLPVPYCASLLCFIIALLSLEKKELLSSSI